MLPWFIKHHLPLFDNAILIDYASTDNSAAIIKELAPNWEIRRSRNEYFRATDCDAEVMDIERSIPGWKIALTSTEFLYCDITALTNNLAIQGHAAAQIRPVAMVDLKERLTDADPSLPLDAQCPTGYMDGWITPYKSRLLHCHPDGAYNTGRHSTNHSNVSWHPEGALLKWFGFAPWTREMRARKTQIQSRMPADDIALGLGFQHLVDEAKLNLMWQSEVALSADLKDIPEYF